MTRESIPGARMALLLAAAVLLALGGGWLAGQHGAHLPLHAGLEMAGAVVALMVAYVLLRLASTAEGGGLHRLQAAALAAMASLDAVHALMPPGQLFVWLHSVATLCGGLWLLSLWVGPRLPPAAARSLPGVALAASLLLAAASLLSPASVPLMVSAGRFSGTAWWLNLIGGTGMLLAALRLFLNYRRSGDPVDLLFSVQWLLLGCGAMMFLQSALWSALWWGWHILRLLGYCVSLWLVTRTLVRLEARIVLHNNRLEQDVASRTRELQQVVDTLKAAQEELVQSEKMAALGALVAGISHELNTPVGTAVTLASTLEDQVGQFRRTVESGALKKSSLAEFLERSGELAGLILKCASRAAELIASFKQVAIDQSSERRREFTLHELVADVVATVRPSIKQAPVRIAVDVAEGLRCDSYPGPLSQVLVNLIQNAVLHAFADRPGGTIRILGRALPGGQLELRVADDGGGMPPAVLAHVFDPFFTTRLGQGGSGIGLAVCHRIAATVLGGSLTADSALGSGACFTLVFPAVAAGQLQGALPAAILKEQHYV